MASEWICECGIGGVSRTDQLARRDLNEHKDYMCPSKHPSSERERALHRDLIATRRDLAVAEARVAVLGENLKTARADAAIREREDLRSELKRHLLDSSAMRQVEKCAGISRLPESHRDNSVAWLDEDLLCEDA